VTGRLPAEHGAAADRAGIAAVELPGDLNFDGNVDAAEFTKQAVSSHPSVTEQPAC
jgi:hypothetical protein